MRLLLTIVALLLFAPTLLHAQTKLPRTFVFKKENNKGSFMGMGHRLGRFYALEPAGFEKYDEGTIPHQALGASVMPEVDVVALIFINAQKERQLSTQKDKSAAIIFDSKQIKDLKYDDMAEGETDKSIIKTEDAFVHISYKNLKEIVKAESVTLRFSALT